MRYTRNRISALAGGVAIAALLAACGGGQATPDAKDATASVGDAAAEGVAKDVPDSLTIAGGAQGSANYNIAAALATLANEHSDVNVTVVPYSGARQQLPAVDSSNPQLGVNDAGTVVQAFEGVGQFDTEHENLRVLSSGSVNQISIAVRADSDITTGADLHGARVTAEYSALPVCQLHATAQLKNLGLSWDDVVPVPVTNSVEGAEALADGRVDAIMCAAPGVAAMRELHAQTPLRFLSMDPSEEAVERAREEYAYIGTDTLPEGAMGYLPNEAVFLAYPWSLYAHESLSDAAARLLVELIWEENDAFRELHPILKGWTPEAMPQPQEDLPFHDGAVAFYKEQGVWPGGS